MEYLFGRQKIFTSADAITAENVVQEVSDALGVHMKNAREESFLYWYRRGMQPILDRTKEVRPEICNKVVVNNADMIVTFKNGYFLTKPATYVSRKEDKEITEKVNQLNEYVYLSGKHEVDNQVVDWFHTVGLGVLYVGINKGEDRDEVPFKVYSLDPRGAFCVYSSTPGNRPMYAVHMVIANKRLHLDVITETDIFTLDGGGVSSVNLDDNFVLSVSKTTVVKQEKNLIGKIPIIEYAYNSLRMSATESTIPIQDAINLIESNRNDGIEQFVQSLMVLYNCELEEGTTANTIRQAGLIQLKSVGENKADVKVMTEQLDQSQTQTTLDDLYEQMLDKAGVPSSIRDGGSTSDNVGSVYLRSGWAMADTHARNTEDEFKRSNAYFDEVSLSILRRKNGFEIKPSEFELKITRNDLSNLLVKTQAAMNMKELGFSPALAFERSGLSNDPLTDVEVSREYIEAKWREVDTTVNAPRNEQDAPNSDDGGDA